MPPVKPVLRLLTIAGSDSGGGAGIQADLKTFSALGGYGMSVICALTAQNTRGVQAIQDVPAGFVDQQLEAVLEDIGVDAVKLGMLQSVAIIETVARRLRSANVKTVVLDPVMVAKSGHALLRDDAVDAIRSLLIPLATVVTPNLPEAAVLTRRTVRSRADMPGAGEALLAMGAEAVLVKGGHLDDESSDDCLCRRTATGGPSIQWLRQPRIETPNTHGTGCTLSSAIAAYLAREESVEAAVGAAKAYLTRALREGSGRRIGHGHGPVHHFVDWW